MPDFEYKFDYKIFFCVYCTAILVSLPKIKIMNNDHAIRILILEDNEIDKKIIFSIIDNSDLEFTTLIVDTKEGFSEALMDFHPDVVLSDYMLPGFNGLQALEIHKKINPDIPFIFVTGHLSEEKAIDCLKLGAWDYIMKDHIKRLPISIKNMLALQQQQKDNMEKEKLIMESEKRYKSLSQLTFEGIAIHDKGVVRDCNLSFCKMFGYSSEELIGKNAIELLVHPDCQKTVLENSKNQITVPYECIGVRKDGTTFHIELEAKNLFYEGEPARVVAVRDITFRMEALEEIKLSEEKFNKISNAAKDPIILMDHHGNVSFWNKAATELLQYSEHEMRGQNLHKIIAPEKYMAAHEKGFKEFLKSGEGNAVGKITELEAIRKDGEIIPVELSLSSINIHGNWNAVGILRDISARKKVEAEMLAAQKYAQEMNQMKTNFLSTMSHELRTPLNGILGFSEILFESLETTEFKTYAETILKSSERILNTFNLIIDLAVLDANKVNVTKKPENIIQIIHDVCESYNSQAAEKNLIIKQNIGLLEATAEIDQMLLTQALNNLLNNAVKYTEKGSITLSLKKVKANNVDCFAVSVSDTGIGIPPEKTSLIYQAFRQVSEGYNRSFEGMGIGLYITKKYVDLLDAFIDMKSEVGNGSSFTIYIPIKGIDSLAQSTSVNVKEPERSPSSDNSTTNVLYVEDDPGHRQFVKIFLKGKYKLSCVENGQKALELVKEQKFDVILMDINLGPGMDGLEVVKKIRQMPEYTETPIAAVTANALVSQKSEYLSSGCNDYITKPFRKQKLLDFIEKIMGN